MIPTEYEWRDRRGQVWRIRKAEFNGRWFTSRVYPFAYVCAGMSTEENRISGTGYESAEKALWELRLAIDGLEAA